MAGWLSAVYCIHDNSQLPTPNDQPLPTPKSQFPITLNQGPLKVVGSWMLEVGSGWELVVGSWELSRNHAKCSHLRYLPLRHLDRIVGGTKRRETEVDDYPGESGGIGTCADLDRHRHRLAIAIDDAGRGRFRQ